MGYYSGPSSYMEITYGLLQWSFELYTYGATTVVLRAIWRLHMGYYSGPSSYMEITYGLLQWSFELYGDYIWATTVVL